MLRSWARASGPIAALVLPMTIGAPARASAPPGARVVIEVAREEGAPRELEEAVVRAVVRVGAEVELVRLDQRPRFDAQRLARVAVRSTGEGLEIEISQAAGRSLRKITRSSSQAVLDEELTLVVESALESAIDAALERRVEPSPPSAPKQPPADPRPAAPTPRAPPATLTVFAAAAGGVGAFGSNAGAVGRLGAGLGVALGGRLRPSLEASVSYTLPFDAGDRRVELDARVVNLRLLPAARFVELSVVSLGAGLGVGLDVMSVNARDPATGTRTQGSPPRVDGVLSPTLLVRAPLHRSLAVSGTFAVDLGFASRTWVVEQEGTRSEIFAPFRARPVGLLGLELTLWGEEQKGARERGRPETGAP